MLDEVASRNIESGQCLVRLRSRYVDVVKMAENARVDRLAKAAISLRDARIMAQEG